MDNNYVYIYIYIYVNPGFPRLFNDVTCLLKSYLDLNWSEFLICSDEYFEAVLEDVGYIGVHYYILRYMGKVENLVGANILIMDAFKKMLVGFRVLVEWDINGLKHKCKCLMKLFDSIHLIYSHFLVLGVSLQITCT